MKKLILILFTFVLFSSCGKLLTKMNVHFYNGSFMITHYSNGQKDVLFIPMIHINKPENFAKIKAKIDSLRGLGYIIYYEGMEFKKEADSMNQVISLRKFKAITGIIPFDYYDKRNKQNKSYAVKGYVTQTAKNTGINPNSDFCADLPFDELIKRYEKEKGEIILTDCDWNTKFLDKYKCRKINADNRYFIVMTLRNRYLADCVVNSSHKKIAVVYGERHSIDFEKGLQKLDSAWHFVPEQDRKELRL